MPVYLFTFHGHGTWMPDHKRGYVHRTRGLQPSDPHMAAAYRRQQKQPKVLFGSTTQQAMVDSARGAGPFIGAVVRGIATEPTHIHVLITWRHQRPWKSMRTSIRAAISRVLNERFGKKDWFSDTPSRRRVRNIMHFDYLMLSYLPKHGGVRWFRDKDVSTAEERDAKRAVSVKLLRKRKRKNK